MLKPGGLIVLRDYGRHDLVQLRFKSGRLMDDNFYIRGDKTRVYFFDSGNSLPPSYLHISLLIPFLKDELAILFSGSRQEPQSDNNNKNSIHPILLSTPPPPALFTIQKLTVDRRLLVNRKRQLKMYRVWMQGTFFKPTY